MPLALLLVLLALLAACAREPALRQAATGSNACRECHAAAVQQFAATGMGRSFHSVGDSTSHEDETPAWRHAASGTWFRLLRRDGLLYHRRWQTGPNGQEEDVEELRADYVLGSGNQVRTYLHRTQRNTLIELPLAHYSAGGGTLALNPGFDTPRPPMRRRIGYDCMFCHNARVDVPAGHEESFAEPVFPATLPSGIDCERCHGPAADHLRAARQPKPSPAELRRTIVNPARLPAGRSLEVCMQCHLETTSFPLPNSVRRFERGPFSYRAGEPLAEFTHYFDHAPGAGHEDKFEIVSSAYRLRQSACFRQSAGALTCTRCHNPHRPAADPQQRAHYNDVCRSCHEGALTTGHPPQPDCTTCHMPKRRAEDVVHSVITDHKIGRPARASLTAAREERHGAAAAYRGRVTAYYPAQTEPLYLAAAQLIAHSNPREGIRQLQRELTGQPARWEFHVILGDALRGEAAAAEYRAALKQRPQSAMLMRRLAAALRTASRDDEAFTWLQQATQADPQDAAAWYDLGVLERNRQHAAAALAALRRAAQADPDGGEIATTLAAVLAETGDAASAERAFRDALRLDPYAGDTRASLATLLAAQGRNTEALVLFEQALGNSTAGPARARFNYGVLLAQAGRFAEAEREVRAALRLEPQLAEAHHILGGLLVQRGDATGAVAAYRQALRLQPAMAKAHLDLGVLLLAQGRSEGVGHVQRAAAVGDPAVREEAARVLSAIK